MLRKAITLRRLPCRTQTASCFPAGCGCPPGWELGLRGPAPGEPQYRPADLVDFLLHRSFRNFQQVRPLRRSGLTAKLALLEDSNGAHTRTSASNAAAWPRPADAERATRAPV
jgi:hypothetical protein